VKKTIIFILCTTVCSTYTFNPEATQKLKEKINKTKEVAEIVNQPFMKEIEQLIKEGADPNVTIADPIGETSLIERLGLLWRQSKDTTALENLFRFAIENGAQIVIDPEKPLFFLSIVEAPIDLVKMAINAGGSKKQVQKNKEAATKIMQEMINDAEKSFKRLQERLQRYQNDTAKYKNFIAEIAEL
jgi:hypothetical protein